jgi:hypothetical protein
MALSITSVTLWNQASCSSEPARLTVTSPGRPLFGAEAERDRAAGLQVFIFCVARYRPLANGRHIAIFLGVRHEAHGRFRSSRLCILVHRMQRVKVSGTGLTALGEDVERKG